MSLVLFVDFTAGLSCLILEKLFLSRARRVYIEMVEQECVLRQLLLIRIYARVNYFNNGNDFNESAGSKKYFNDGLCFGLVLRIHALIEN